jgi:hypothetical protein
VAALSARWPAYVDQQHRYNPPETFDRLFSMWGDNVDRSYRIQQYRASYCDADHHEYGDQHRGYQDHSFVTHHVFLQIIGFARSRAQSFGCLRQSGTNVLWLLVFSLGERKNEQQKKGYHAAAGEKAPCWKPFQPSAERIAPILTVIDFSPRRAKNR